MAYSTWQDKIFGTFMFVMAICFVSAWAMVIAGRVGAWLQRFVRPQVVEQTVNQMYGDVHVEHEYAGSRNAAQQIKRERRHPHA